MFKVTTGRPASIPNVVVATVFLAVFPPYTSLRNH